MKKVTSGFIFILFSLLATAQLSPIEWKIVYDGEKNGINTIKIIADINEEWYIYGMNIKEGGPLPLSFSIKDSDKNMTTVSFNEITVSEKKFDKVFMIDVTVFNNKAEFLCEFSSKQKLPSIDLLIEGQACNKKNGSCMPIFEEISVNLNK
jgi:thiol:disulfide interchange protein DsbD